MDGPGTAEAVRPRRGERVAKIAGIALVVSVVFAMNIYVGVVVVLSPAVG